MKRILLIDNDENSNAIWEARLTGAGYAVQCVINGKDALVNIQSYKPDLAIIDIMLGDMDGIELCEQIRRSWSPEQLPILAFSTDKTYAKRALRIADDFIWKFDDDYEASLTRIAKPFQRQKSQLCLISIMLDKLTDTKSSCTFSFKGAVNVAGPTLALELEHAKMYRRMDLIGNTTYEKYEQWLKIRRSRNREDIIVAETALRDTKDWYEHIVDIGKDLYRSTMQFLHNSPEYSINYGRATALTSHGNISYNFSGRREDLALPFEAMSAADQRVPLVVTNKLFRQVNFKFPINYTSWRELIKSLKGQELKVLLVASEERTIPEVMAVHDRLSAAMSNIDISVRTFPTDLTKPVSFEQFQDFLKSTYHIIHYAGHAVYDRQHPEDSCLLFRNDKLEEARVETNELFRLFQQKTPNFIYFSCCSASEVLAEYSMEQRLLGLSDAAIQAGISNVLGFRWPVVSRDAAEFARHFYDHLILNPYSLEEALLHARQQVYYQSRSKDRLQDTWFSPMLITQKSDIEQ